MILSKENLLWVVGGLLVANVSLAGFVWVGDRVLEDTVLECKVKS